MLVRLFPYGSDDYHIVLLLNDGQKEIIKSMFENSCKMISGDASDDEMFEMLDMTGYDDAECAECGKEFLSAKAPQTLYAKYYSLTL